MASRPVTDGDLFWLLKMHLQGGTECLSVPERGSIPFWQETGNGKRVAKAMLAAGHTEIAAIEQRRPKPVDPWELLRELLEAVRFDSDDVTYQDCLDEAALDAEVALKQHDAERKSDGP